MNETILHISGMTCNHCVMRVSKALQKISGVESAQVDLSKAEAIVHGSAQIEAIVAAVKDAGYGAEVKH